MVIDDYFHPLCRISRIGGDLYWPSLTAVGFDGIRHHIGDGRDDLSRIDKDVPDARGNFDFDIEIFPAGLAAGQLYGLVQHLADVRRSRPGLGRLGEGHQVFNDPGSFAGVLINLPEDFPRLFVVLGFGK